MAKNIALVILAVCVLSCNRGGPTEPWAETKTYFPLAQGNTWLYDYTDPAGRTVVEAVGLGTAVTYENVRWYPEVYHACIGPSSATPLACASFAHSGNKVLVRPQGQAWSAPWSILDFPLYQGKSWILSFLDTTYYIGGSQVTIQSTHKRFFRGFETVAVPAGWFTNCARVEDSAKFYYRIDNFDGDPNEIVSQSNTVEWFAPYVGIIKQSSAHRTLRELRSYNVSVR